MASALIRLFAGLVLTASAATAVLADTIYLKGKKSLKGVIVDEQADRYILNTADGEIEVLKSLTEAVKYDDPELSYYQLGRQLQRAGRLREAYAAYDQAAQLRPDFQAAREAAFNVQRLMSRQDESEVIADVRRQQLISERAGRPAEPTFATPAPTPAAAPTFEERFGCRLRYDAGQTIVTQVQLESLAGLAGLHAGDEIIAVWNDPIRNLGPEAISRRLNESRGELALTIERVVLAATKDVQVTLGYDGLRIASIPEGAAQALAVNDLVVTINRQPARYLDAVKAKKLLSEAPETQFVVQRGLILRERVKQ